MSIQSRILNLFPILQLTCLFAFGVLFIIHPTLLYGLLILASIYLLPLLTYKIHQAIYPVKKGIYRLNEPQYCPWWGSYQIQFLLNTFPVFERVIHCIPGLYSIWLRAWGSSIGNHVLWTPHVEITDRGFMQVSDQVIIGHKVGFYPHIIQVKEQDILLVLKPIRIESRCFIGAGSVFAPGSHVKEGSVLAVGTQSYGSVRQQHD